MDGLPELVIRLRDAGYTVTVDEPLPAYASVCMSDPFGNRLELLEPER
jgi:hypothetical protein